MNLLSMLSLLQAGGPGSGRHPYATATAMDVLSHHDFEKTGNTEKGNSRYENSSGDVVISNPKTSLWVHKEKYSGGKTYGSGIVHLDNHLAKAYGNDKYSESSYKQSLVHAVGSVSKEQDIISTVSDDSEEVTASFGIGSDSFHWGLMDALPSTTKTVKEHIDNPGNKVDKKRRKSKAFRKYEEQLQFNQGHGKVMVTTQQADNSDVIDGPRSDWFV